MKLKKLSIPVIVFFLLFTVSVANLFSVPIIIDHTCTKLDSIPESAILQARDSLHIAYGHASHGSQLTEGMTALANQDSNLVGWKGDIYHWGHDISGYLDIDDYFVEGDLGHYGDTQWAANTRDYLENNPDASNVNVIVWSWCGGCSDNTYEGIQTYLDTLNALEMDYPNIKFVYMTGHTDIWNDATLKANNQHIRDYCYQNDKILYDFADIERYDPDGTYFEYTDENCDYYDSNQNLLGNWATEWQDTHTEGVDWFDCTAMHSQPLNGNLKAYSAWWLWCRLAGWTPSHPTSYTVYPTSLDFGQINITSSDTKTFKITNVDTVAVTIDSLSSNSSIFTLTDTGSKLAGFTIPVGGSRTIQVTFSPQAVQNYTGEITIYSSQFTNSTVTLAGSGTNSPSGGYHVCGNVSGIWNEPLIYVDCDILVTENDSLIINPPTSGTDIIFTGHYKFSVRGKITINATQADSVRFDAQDPATGWFGLRFYDTTWNNFDSSRVAYCSFKNGKANGSDLDGYGGGLFLNESSKVNVEYCTFENNSATNGGGGLYIIYGSPDIKNCIFNNNTAPNGGGAYLAGTSATIQYCNFLNNNSTSGGAFYIDNDTPLIKNCVIYENTADSGAAFYLNSSSANISNCTISKNTAVSNSGIVVLYNWASPTMVNSILWDETSSEIVVLADGGSIDATYSDIYNGWTGTGNINSDPLFEDATNNDFTLTASSPCIDAGNPSTYDSDGTICDMGAIFYNQTPINAPINVQICINSGQITLSWDAVSGASSYKVYSSDNATFGFTEDTSGTFSGTTWTVSISQGKKFYYVTAMN